jgi:hypothetical protein
MIDVRSHFILADRLESFADTMRKTFNDMLSSDIKHLLNEIKGKLLRTRTLLFLLLGLLRLFLLYY